MAKGDRQRKRERAKREAQASRRRAAAQRRRAAEAMVDEMMARYARILDPATPVPEVAGVIAEEYGDQAVPAFLAARMAAEGSSAERLAGVAAALTKSGPSPAALTFAASVAQLSGDAATARRLLDEALAAGGDDAGTRLEVVKHVRAAGRVADAIEMLEERLREEPADDLATELYGLAMEQAQARADGERPPGDCPCGAGPSWRECCCPREEAALSRFADRSGLIALRDAVGAYLAGSEYGPAVEERVAATMDLADDLEWEPAERASFGLLAAELALLTAELPDAGEAGDGDAGDGEAGDEGGGALAAFAADPSTPATLAVRADAWSKNIHYGLWRVDDRRAAPGLWCTDLGTGVSRYVQFPAEVAAGMPRWAVWLGGVVPVDGIWRCTGLGSRLSPAEGDAAAELVREISTDFMYELIGQPEKRSRRPGEPMRFGLAEPRGVYVDSEEPASYAAGLITRVTAGLLPRIVAEVHARRSAPPALHNTDGDPMCLVTARITVRDGSQVAERLAARRDFERAEDDPSRLTWYGLEVPRAQREALMAEVIAQMRASGQPDAELADDDGPQRWVRGTLDIRGDQVTVEANSQERLARLVGVLSGIGADPVVTDEKRIDPAQDLAWPGGAGAFPRGAAPAAEGWEKHWLDEPVPALDGRTPRDAADGDERPLLEALLRQFEYEADLLAAQGKAGIDTAWLRQELDMSDE